MAALFSGYRRALGAICSGLPSHDAFALQELGTIFALGTPY